ncbi:hypothetical protein FB567DRAFT_586125 [Paraphoma chrysanthemicola]|uniref:BTB domain-containing protein n=1 Tax=Paraphoma chrysanthemicola TaxID=798071 RepID=A0A8K0RJ90_9PLEO|nr:hypothetical protein FB567DRAFT_586125 [Paraphoma chrysanthemicola]
MPPKRQLSKSAPSTGDSTSRSKRTKTPKSIAKIPDVPIKIHVGSDDPAGEVYIHRSRLERVSPWFRRQATHCEVIELDNVTVTTLQAFYTWVYDRHVVVDGMEEEMDKVKLNNNETTSKRPTVETSHATASSQSKVIDGTEEEMDNAKLDDHNPTNKRPTAETSHATASSQSKVVDLTEDSDDDVSEDEDAGKSDENSSTAHSSSEDVLPWYMTAGHDTRDQIFGQLTHLYSFGTTHEIADFSFAVVLAWQRFSYKTSTYPCATFINHICQRVSLKSGLMQYVINCYANYIPVEDVIEEESRWKTIPSDFLTEVFIVSLEQPKLWGLGPNEEWCEYHNHDSDEAERSCLERERRPEDPRTWFSDDLATPARGCGPRM